MGSKARKTPPEHGASFGRLVRQLRNARGLTQEVLAEHADLSPDTVRRLEHGSFSPSLETLVKVVNGLGTNLTTLFAAFEGTEDATAREILTMARRMSGLELALAMRLLSLLAEMLKIVSRAIEDVSEDDDA